MNKNSQKQNKKLFIALIVCAIAAIIAVLTVSIVLGVNAANEPIDNPGGIIDDNNNNNNNDNTDNDDNNDDNNDNDDNNNDNDDNDDDEANTSAPYELPLSEFELGQSFNITEVVWSETLQWYTTHNGTDFIAEAGTVVTSISAGTVTSAKYTTQEGYVVTIEATDGNTIIYKSLSTDILVEEGDTVTVGTNLGYVSDSMSSEQNVGPHLHLEILDENGEYVDPITLLPEISTDK